MVQMTNVTEPSEAWTKAWPKVVAKAWMDEAFMKRLMSNPAEAMKECGLPSIPGFSYQVAVGNQPCTVTLYVPPKPENLKDEKLEDLMAEAVTVKCAESCCL